jgi:isoleucyl-tRNA synthetase
MSIVAQRIKTLNPEQIKTLEEKKSVSIQLNEKNITLELADVEIYFKDIQGWQVAQGHGLSVALDVTLNDTLIQEGVSRELVNRIQNLRKEHGFEITDTILIELELQPELQVAVEQNKDYVLTETLGVTLDFISKIEKGTIIEFDNIKTKINIQKIES